MSKEKFQSIISNHRVTNKYLFKPLFLPFILGTVSAITINALGKIYIGEIFSILYLLIARNGVNPLKYIPKPFVSLSLLWSFVQLLSDILNRTGLSDSLKGVLAPIILLLTILGLVKYFNESISRFPSFLLGLPIGLLLDISFINPTIYFLAENKWKWGIGDSVQAILITYFSFFVSKVSSHKFNYKFFLALISISLIGLANESRGTLSLIFLYFVYLCSRLSIVEKFLYSIKSSKRAGIILFISLIFSLVIASSYGVSLIFNSPLITSIMPENIVAKNASQSKSSLGLLFGGRSEIFGSSAAFIDRPIFGHGSWAKDRNGYYTRLRAEKSVENGEDEYEVFGGLDYAIETNELLIPTHSYLMGSLVSGGLLAGLFWIYTLYFTFKIYINNFKLFNFYFIYSSYSLIWGIFFSFFGYSTRFSTAIILSGFISYFICISAHSSES